MNHAQLKAFHAVAKSGGFTSAAKSLGLTQPAITLQVQALERKYNTPLFVRRGRQIDLTQSGLLLLSLSSRYFDLEEEAHNLLSSIMQFKAGNLRIVSDLPYRFFPLTKDFRDKYPNIDLSVSICSNQQLRENLLDHLVDIAITDTLPEETDLEFCTILEENLTVTLPIQHPAKEDFPISIEELADQKVFIFKDKNDFSAMEEELFKTAGISKENIITFDNRTLILEAVAHNQGISFLSKNEVAHDKRLKSVPLADCSINREEYIVYHKEKRNTPLITAFKNMLLSE